MSLFAIAVIKELAPVKGAETDKILGVGEFQTKYFLDYPVYLDPNKAFYAALGKSGVARLLSILLHLIHQMCCLSEELKSSPFDPRSIESHEQATRVSSHSHCRLGTHLGCMLPIRR